VIAPSVCPVCHRESAALFVSAANVPFFGERSRDVQLDPPRCGHCLRRHGTERIDLSLEARLEALREPEACPPAEDVRNALGILEGGEASTDDLARVAELLRRAVQKAEVLRSADQKLEAR
jgi:hypothetical protein